MSKREGLPILRVWPEWESSGIWAPPFPASQIVGPMIDYDLLDLPPELVARFVAWQDLFNDRDPSRDEIPDGGWGAFHAENVALAHALHAVVGGVVQWEEGDFVRTVGEDGPGIKMERRDQ